MNALKWKGAVCALSVVFSAAPALGQAQDYYAPNLRVASNDCATCNSGGSGISYGQPGIGGCASCGGAGCAACADSMMYSECGGGGGLASRLGGIFSSDWAGQGSCFYGGANGLLMTRDDDDRLLLTYNGNERNALTSRDADFGYSGGFEAFMGAYLNCGRNAVEARYWGIFPGIQSASSLGRRTTRRHLLVPAVHEFGHRWRRGAAPVLGFFDGAERHQLTRSYQVHNVELNYLGLVGCGTLPNALYGGDCSGGLTMTWLAGIRYLRFDDGLTFATSPDNLTFNDANDIFYNANVINSLLGFQLGGRGYYALGCRTSIYTGIKAGVFGNEIRQHQSVTSATGAVAVTTAGPDAGADYDINNSKTDVSLLGEIDLGMNYRLTPCWNVNLGYRAVGLSGVGLATSQLPRTFFDNLDDPREVKSNGHVILHGAYLGMSYNY